MTDDERELAATLGSEYAYLDCTYDQGFAPRPPGGEAEYIAEWNRRATTVPTPVPVHQQTWNWWNERDHQDFMRLCVPCP